MIPVIDLFAGAGGLGEGFAACVDCGTQLFRVTLSVEENMAACQTLELRAFYRKFSRHELPEDYYRTLRGMLSQSSLFERYPGEAAAARREVKRATLGAASLTASELDGWIADAVAGEEDWVLIGGPPCQAYSIAGRSRNRSKVDYVPEEDDRHFLYREYLRVLAQHWPSVFIMENVPGILTAKIRGTELFGRILDDLSDPADSFQDVDRGSDHRFRYRLYSLVRNTEHDMYGVPVNPKSDFIIESGRFGIPQARDRVIVLGVRDDIELEPKILEEQDQPVTAGEVLRGLPRLRAGLARTDDSGPNWLEALQSVTETLWFRSPRTIEQQRVVEAMERTIERLTVPRSGRGSVFVRCRPRAAYRPDWYLDERLGGACNSETRAHFAPDLHRYLFAASFADLKGHSPRLADFPDELMPEHRNVNRALTEGDYGDRFRVQVSGEPARTVTRHIARDGHYFIHYDPSQCRSITVREAARFQTFPDNYFFFGNRGEQYSQVGNAVPPLLAVQIADVVSDLFLRARTQHHGRYAVA